MLVSCFEKQFMDCILHLLDYSSYIQHFNVLYYNHLAQQICGRCRYISPLSFEVFFLSAQFIKNCDCCVFTDLLSVTCSCDGCVASRAVFCDTLYYLFVYESSNVFFIYCSSHFTLMAPSWVEMHEKQSTCKLTMADWGFTFGWTKVQRLEKRNSYNVVSSMNLKLFNLVSSWYLFTSKVTEKSKFLIAIFPFCVLWQLTFFTNEIVTLS